MSSIAFVVFNYRPAAQQHFEASEQSKSTENVSAIVSHQLTAVCAVGRSRRQIGHMNTLHVCLESTAMTFLPLSI